MDVRPGERCEMCGVTIGGDHRHVVDTTERALQCLCPHCFMLFSDPAASNGRYRQVGRRYVALDGAGIDDGAWEALAIPVALAFFFRSSALDRPVAFYPGPAGATESLLPLDAWQAVLDRNPDFAATAPDVEAVIVRRDGRRQRVLHRPHRCVLRARRAVARAMDRLRRRGRGGDARSASSSSAPAASASDRR